MQCNAIQCNATQCNAMQCHAMQCTVMQFNAMQCNVMQLMRCNWCNASKRNISICQADYRSCILLHSCVGLSEAVDWCICFTRKIQHGGEWERSRPQGPKNVHNFLMTVRHLSWACGLGTEMLLILKKTILDLIIERYFQIGQPKGMSHDFVRGQSVAETCFSHWDNYCIGLQIY